MLRHLVSNIEKMLNYHLLKELLNTSRFKVEGKTKMLIAPRWN